MNPFWGLALFIMLAGIYFLPVLVCEHRKHKNTSAILVVNLFLGWTLIGWVVALAWACLDDGKGQAAAAPPAQ